MTSTTGNTRNGATVMTTTGFALHLVGVQKT